MEKDFTKFMRSKLEALHSNKVFTNKKELALKSGLGESAVYDALNERSKSPKISTAEGLAKGLNLSFWQLFYTDKELAEEKEIREAVLGTEVAAIAEIWEEIDEGQRELAFDIMKDTLKKFKKRDTISETQE